MESEQKSRLGPSGRRVAANLKQLRGRVPVRELSARLAKVGRPILPSGVTKIEQGSRRVDADDLVALALVLDVTPNRLLLTDGIEGDRIDLAPAFEPWTRHEAWGWACGDHLMVHDAAGDDIADFRPSTLTARYERFARVNRPHVPRDEPSLADFVAHKEKLSKLAELVAELEREGVPRKAAYHFVDVELYFAERGDDGEHH
jgi:transcriptional regulator with XRE-family HTH domain